jgi:hypothetical protein
VNQAQWTGERLLRDDPCWSPQPVPLKGVGVELLATVRSFGALRGRVFAVFCATPDKPLSLPALRKSFPDVQREDVARAVMVWVDQGLLERSGGRGSYSYQLTARGRAAVAV